MSLTRSPIPLMLLIPVLLIVAVLVSALYNFSSSNDKDTSHLNTLPPDPISQVVFGPDVKGPLQVHVPEVSATAVMDTIEKKSQTVSGRYVAGAEQGRIAVVGSLMKTMTVGRDHLYVIPFRVTNQGSGSFYYLGLFKNDPVTEGVSLIDSYYVGDRIGLTSLEIFPENKVTLHYLGFGPDQVMADQPNLPKQLKFAISATLKMQVES